MSEKSKEKAEVILLLDAMINMVDQLNRILDESHTSAEYVLRGGSPKELKESMVEGSELNGWHIEDVIDRPEDKEVIAVIEKYDSNYRGRIIHQVVCRYEEDELAWRVEESHLMYDR